MSKRDKKNITLGSGKLYYTEYTGEIPDVETLCVADNLMGYIKGGASIEYTMEKYEEKDDLGLVSKIITTSEEALLKCGLLTWNGETLTKLTARGTTKEESGRRITKIGGAGNNSDTNYVWCFKHEDKNDGNLWVLVVGQNQAGFTITFAADAGSVLEPEIKAIPHDEDGTLIELIEEIDGAA
jgi:hypothetical protein